MALSKIVLSGSTDGKPIKITAAATAGITVHDAGASGVDSVWVWGWNTDTTDRTVTFEVGGVTDPDNLIEVPVTASDGLQLLLPGIAIQNSVNLDAFASAANVVMLVGYVIRDA